MARTWRRCSARWCVSSRIGRPSRPRCRSQSARCCRAVWSRIAGSASPTSPPRGSCWRRPSSLAPPTSLDAAVSQRQADAAVADVRRALARSTRRRVALVGAGTFLAGLVVAGVAAWLLTRPAPLSVVRMTMTTSGATALTLSGTDRDVAITPDGSRVVYRGNGQLLVRALNQLEPTVLSGLARRKAYSSRRRDSGLDISTDTTIKKVAITGGSPITIATVVGSVSRGATWGPDGTIIFATATAATALMRVSAAGGEPTVLTKSDRARGESDHVWPEFLPGGKAVLFTITSARRHHRRTLRSLVLDLQTGTRKVLIRGGSDAHYVPTGHLVYGFAGTLRAVRIRPWTVGGRSVHRRRCSRVW